MIEQPGASRSIRKRRPFLWAALGLIAALLACSIYANLSFTVRNPASYRFFPPFEKGVNANDNGHLGAEYFNIARSLVAGKGFAHPFPEPTGPTAWMPPVLPGLLAAFLWLTDNDKNVVMAIVIFLQVYSLAMTGLLVMALARSTTGRLGAGFAAAVFLVAVLCNFRLWFQFTHDYWLILLALDGLVAGLCWGRPLGTALAAAGWGLFGGLCALINPVVTLAWGVFTLGIGLNQRTWSRLALALGVAALTLLPWTVRNYHVFGRWIPVKSNLAYELYQSQCLQRDGVLQGRTFRTHPIADAQGSRREYKELGEIAFLDEKRERFRAAVQADPADFLDRIASRLLAATLWYVPLDRAVEEKAPWILWLGRLTHPLPFLALLFLVLTAVVERLSWAQRTVIGIYVLYLLPYVVVSYYERYAMPLVGIKALLVIWGMDRLVCLALAKKNATGTWFGRAE